MGGLLEVLRGGSLLHLRLQLGRHLVALAIEEIATCRYLHQILLARDVADARRGADLHVRVEAVLVIARVGIERTAAAQVEFVADQVERPPQRAAAGERAEVARTIVNTQAREREARDGVVEVDLEHQEPLVVAEGDVVTRVELLDELAFEQHGLGVGLHHVPVEVVDGLDEGVELEVPAHAPRSLKILGDAAAEVARLADVNHRAEAVLVQIHAGPVRHLRELAADVVGDGHLLGD